MHIARICLRVTVILQLLILLWCWVMKVFEDTVMLPAFIVLIAISFLPLATRAGALWSSTATPSLLGRARWVGLVFDALLPVLVSVSSVAASTDSLSRATVYCVREPCYDGPRYSF
jgi:hypothetical protein